MGVDLKDYSLSFHGILVGFVPAASGVWAVVLFLFRPSACHLCPTSLHFSFPHIFFDNARQSLWNRHCHGALF